MAPNSKKRKAADLEGDHGSSKVTNGYASPSTEGRQSTPPLIGLDASEVPFKVNCPAQSVRKKSKGGKADVYGPLEEDGGHTQLEITYTVRPGEKWAELKPYRNFIVADNKFSLGSHVYISHPNSPKNPSDYKFVASDENAEPDFWVAKVLEVRASDQQHVYLRVFWLYWPDELPGGRQPYHGQNEVVMSNHMDVIDAMTVSGAADIRQWHERDEDEDLPSLFFRQFYNIKEKEPLSALRRHCICKQYYNPDGTMLKCNNKDCDIWLHEKCLIDDVLAKTYKRIVIEGNEDLSAEDMLTPSKQKATVVKDQPISGLLSAAAETLLHPLQSLRASMSPGPRLKSEPDAEDDQKPTAVASVADTAFKLNATTGTPKANGKSPATKGSRSTTKSKGKGRGKKSASSGDSGDHLNGSADQEVIETCFSARIESSSDDNEPVKVVIEDLRPGKGGRRWKEDLFCIQCGKRLD